MTMLFKKFRHMRDEEEEGRGVVGQVDRDVGALGYMGEDNAPETEAATTGVADEGFEFSALNDGEGEAEDAEVDADYLND